MFIKSIGKTATKNIIFHIIDGSLFFAGCVFIEKTTIMVAFVKQIYDNPLAVGCIPGLILFGFNMPGLFTTHIAKRFRIRKKYVLTAAFFQRFSLLLLVGSTFFITRLSPVVAVIFVLFSFFLFYFAGGISIPAWLDFVAKTVPISHRARTFALRVFFGSIAGIFFPLFIHYLFSVSVFPANYRYSFICAFILILLSYIALGFVKEEKESPVPDKHPFKEYLVSLLHTLKNNPNFRNLLITQVIFSVTSLGAAFYTAYALDTYPDITAQTVILYTLFLNISKGGSSLVMGFLGDRFGNLLVLKINTIVTTLTLILAVFFPSHITFFILFILLGISLTGNLNTNTVFITEFGDDKDRILHSTVNRVIIGFASGLVPVIGGLILSLKILEYKGLFMIAVICGIVSIVFSFFLLKEPRRIKDDSSI